MAMDTASVLYARMQRSPPSRRVTIAMAAVLAAATLLAVRLGVAPPLAWLVLGLVWLAIRLAIFETATALQVPVARWRFGDDVASPSLDVSPEDHLAWPVLAIPAPSAAPREIPAPFAFYLYEFRSRDNVDADLPETLPVRYRQTPLGLTIMLDDRAYVLVGPALFAAVMLLVWLMWTAILSLVTVV